MNKKIINGTLVFITVCLVFYLTGAFSCASFNIKEWDAGIRGIIAGFGVFIGFVLVIVSQKLKNLDN